MHSNLNDHNYWSESLLDTEHSSALEILGSKVGSSSDSSYVLDYQEKTGKQQPKVANIRLKGNNNKCQGNKNPRKVRVLAGFCDM